MSKKINDILEILLDFEGVKVRDYCERKLNEGLNPYDVFKELTKGLDEIGSARVTRASHIVIEACPMGYSNNYCDQCGANLKPQFQLAS
jgi:hypothetical protein